MEVMRSVAPQVKDAMIKQEMEQSLNSIKSTPVSMEEHYAQLGDVGKMIYNYVQGENFKRARALSNPSILKYFRTYFDCADRWSKEHGYKYEDITVSKDSGITRDGVLVINFVPKIGATREEL